MNGMTVMKCVAEIPDLDGGDATVIYSKYILKLLYCTDQEGQRKDNYRLWSTGVLSTTVIFTIVNALESNSLDVHRFILSSFRSYAKHVP